MKEFFKSLYGSYRTFAYVDRNAIIRNGRIAKKLFPQQKILSVLKADAYGHGISGVVSAYDAFTDWYAVATYEEAIEVRSEGCTSCTSVLQEIICTLSLRKTTKIPEFRQFRDFFF